MAENRRAKFLPGTLAEKYVEAVGDPELLNLREDAGLIEIRMSQLLAKIETSDPKQKWTEFGHIVEKATQGALDGDMAIVTAMLLLLSQRIDEKKEDYQVWAEISELIESRRRVIESESNRLVRMQQMINAEDAMRLVDTLLGAVKRFVKEPQIYAAIAYEFAVATGAAHNGISERRAEEVQPDRSGVVDKTELLGPGTQGSDTTR